ncbi:aminotransferase-like domain-containing protein [Streptomyces laurentii]|uniref:aminotransferase-like domain-containing protein n=1 Tax=Streptomyces laurentii TaxID=39478 RepID=UPI0036CA63FA
MTTPPMTPPMTPLPTSSPDRAPRADPAWRVSRHASGLAPSVIAEALRQAAEGGAISLAAGCPAEETLPVAEARALVERVLARPGALQYGDTSGLPGLRTWIAQDTARRTGRSVASGQVVITHGSQQALDLVCRALLDPGDTVIVDRPSYSGALHVLGLHQARVRAVPIAADPDPDLSALEGVLAEGPPARLVYVVPNFANPTGASLTAGRRRALARLAERYGCVVVEDDPYRDLAFGPAGGDTGEQGEPEEQPEQAPPLAALSDRVVALGSFSKVLSPAARTGYLVAPEPLAPLLRTMKEAVDLGNSAFTQALVLALVTEPGLLERRLATLRSVYRDRQKIMVAALGSYLGEELEFQVPAGGFFVWGRLTGGGDTRVLLPLALREGVAFVPGAAFYAHDPDVSTLRLSYAAADPTRLGPGCLRLARAVGRLRAGPRPGRGA